MNYAGSGPLYDAPDPTSVPNYADQSGSTAQILATGTPNNGYNILSQNWTTGTQTVGPTGDALPNANVPTYLTQKREFAPSVEQIGNQYVMWYSGENKDGRVNCLEAATSPTPYGQFVPVGPVGSPTAWCDDTPNVGDLDPQIWKDVYDGTEWLVFSQQESAANNNGVAYSGISIVSLTTDGTAIDTRYCMRIIAMMSNVQQALPSVYNGANNGANSQLENPDMVYDNTNGTAPDGKALTFDMYASYGTYNDDNAYHTVEIACEDLIGPCYDANAVEEDGNMLTAAPLSLQNPGGLEVAHNAPSGEFALFAAAKSGNGPSDWMPRGLFYDPLLSVQGNAGPINTSPTQFEGYYPPQPTNSP